MTEEEIKVLFEKSKDDKSIIVGSDIRQLVYEIVKLREALEFYASGWRCDIYVGPTKELIEDFGVKARKALRNTGGRMTERELEELEAGFHCLMATGEPCQHHGHKTLTENTIPTLIKEIRRLNHENVASLIGQEHRLGGQIDKLEIKNQSLRELLREAKSAMNVAPTCLQSADRDFFEKVLKRIDAALEPERFRGETITGSGQLTAEVIENATRRALESGGTIEQLPSDIIPKSEGKE